MGLVEAIKSLLVTDSKYKMKTSSPQLISLVLSILFTLNSIWKKQGGLETWNKKPHPFLASGTEKLMEKQKHILSADGAKKGEWGSHAALNVVFLTVLEDSQGNAQFIYSSKRNIAEVCLAVSLAMKCRSVSLKRINFV